MGLLRRSGGGTLDALIVGLGNPGRQYARTRHNIGFMVVDRIAERTGASWRGKYDGRFAETTLGDARVALLEPETFMNLSGRSVSAAARFYKLEPQNVIVVYDDIELEFDKVRAKAGGGLKGHNGLRSLADVARHARLPARPLRRRPPAARRPALRRRLRARRLLRGRGPGRPDRARRRLRRGDPRRRHRRGRAPLRPRSGRRHVGHRAVGTRVGARCSLERRQAARHRQLAAVTAGARRHQHDQPAEHRSGQERPRAVRGLLLVGHRLRS